MTRRDLLRHSAAALAAGFECVAAPDASRRRNILVAIFQRGAADGLNIIVPHADRDYYRLRPTIAVPRSAVIDLDGFFGLHPALASLNPIYAAGELAVVHAAGLPYPMRSHFDAQNMMESPLRALGAAVPKYPCTGLIASLKRIAHAIKSGENKEIVCLDSGGWDHHFDENAKLAGMLFELGSALAAFREELGDRMEYVTVVTMSEFGRSARENANRGTDHGYGNVMFAMGGGIRGGKVYGRWPGLSQEKLHEEHGLAVTTDFRDVLGETVWRRLGTRNLREMFPGYEGGTERFPDLFKG